MNVVNVTENNLRVSIEFSVLKSTFFNFVCLSIQIRSCVVNDYSRVVNDLFGAIGCLANVLNHDFIFSYPLAEHSVHALGGAPYGAAILLIVVAQCRHPIFSPEFRTGN